MKNIRINREFWIALAQTPIFLALLYEHLNDKPDRSIFDYGIEALVYVMPMAILYGIIKRRLALKGNAGDP